MRKVPWSSEIYDEMEVMPWGEREKYLNEKLTWVVKYAYENASSTRERFDEAGIHPDQIRTLNDLPKIPVLKKEQLRELQKERPPFGGLEALPLDKLSKVYVSPGPIYDPQGPLGTQSFVQTYPRTFYAAGIRRGDPTVIAFSYHALMPGHLFDAALTEIGGVVIPVGPGNTELQVKILHDLGVRAYVSNPSYLLTVIRKAEEMGYDFRRDFQLRVASFTGEMLPPSLREIYEQDYGINVTQHFGYSDIGGLAYECQEKSGMHIMPEAIVEVADPDGGDPLSPGEVGEIVTTTFNEAYPLIRIGSGDLGSYTDELCPCGRTNPRLVSIVGRIGDAFRVRGMFLHGEGAKSLISRFPDISTFQIVLSQEERKDVLTFRCELRDESIDQGGLTNRLRQSFKDICRLNIDNMEFVKPGTIPKEHKIIVDKRVWK